MNAHAAAAQLNAIAARETVPGRPTGQLIETWAEGVLLETRDVQLGEPRRYSPVIERAALTMIADIQRALAFLEAEGARRGFDARAEPEFGAIEAARQAIEEALAIVRAWRGGGAN